MKISTVLSIFLGLARAAGEGVDDHSAPWTYNTWGADWPEANVAGNECGSTNQSPIDLPYLMNDKTKIINAKRDNFQKLYSDQTTGSKIYWDGHTSKITITNEGEDLQKFSSWYSQDFLNGPDKFDGLQFHFHHGSEHTIDGVRHDLEMHTVHVPTGGAKNGIRYAAMGIMFSVDKHNSNSDEKEIKIIDEFFDRLRWDVTSSDPMVDKVSYGELMMMVDMDNRWVYKGSVTTPPCATLVYWNVCRKIYPLKQKYLTQFKEQLKRGDLVGNYREVQEVDKHYIHIIQSDGAKPGELAVGVVVLSVIFVVCTIISIFAFLRFNWVHSKDEK